MLNSRGLKVIAWTNHNVDAALSWLQEAGENNWPVSQLRKQIQLVYTDKSIALIIGGLTHLTLYPPVNNLYSLMKCVSWIRMLHFG